MRQTLTHASGRRAFARQLARFALCMPLIPMPLVSGATTPALSALKAGYARRLHGLLGAGALPYIDIESSCRSGSLEVEALVQRMDRCQIGLMALSADIGEKQFERGVRYDPLSAQLLARYPDRFIPVGNGGQPPALTEDPEGFLAAQAAAAGEILLLGEYEFRHYPSPRQARRGQAERDVAIPLDGPTGHRLFQLSEATGLSFQLHYEVEDELLPALEAMLTQYPRATVIWCHLAQVRYQERASRYNAAYLDGLLRRHPRLHLDLAFGDAQSVYPLSGQRHARVWGAFGPGRDWLDLLVAHPTRFLSALDLGQDRLDKLVEADQRHRQFLRHLPTELQHQVAYRNAWRLLFGEEFS